MNCKTAPYFKKVTTVLPLDIQIVARFTNTLSLIMTILLGPDSRL